MMLCAPQNNENHNLLKFKPKVQIINRAFLWYRMLDVFMALNPQTLKVKVSRAKEPLSC